MKYIFLLLILFSCTQGSKTSTALESKAVKSAPDHIIIVWLENHGYSQIIGSPNAPYINSLKDSGLLFTNFHGVTHPSQPNYVAFYSGDTSGITRDDCLNKKLKRTNLFAQLDSANKTCIWYSEGLPAQGSTICRSGDYVRKHNASSDFKNVPDSANKPFNVLPADYSTLPNVVIISPNVQHDMHNGTIQQGDAWLQTNLSALATWCKTHNSIFIITFDEDDRHEGNRIPVVAYGQNIINGLDTNNYNHYDLTKTICSLFGANQNWTNNLINSTVINSLK